MDAAAILSIPISSPFRLFPRKVSEREALFRQLVKTWHPDRGGDGKVFSHINALHGAAKKAVDENSIVWSARDGKTYRFEAKKVRSFELGRLAIGDSYVAFMLGNAHTDLTMQGIRMIGSVRYPDAKLKEMHQKLVPEIAKVIDTSTEDVVMIKKRKDAVLLRDVLEHFNGAIDPRHVAWIVSRLLDICCFYEVIHMCHNGLSIDTVFVEPATHLAFPLGGWWYAVKRGEQLKSVPPETFAVMPYSVRTAKLAEQRLDLECIRGIARTCLGTDMSKVPQAFRDYVRLPAPKSPLADYEAWQQVLKDSFGPRKFVKLELTSTDIYQ